MSYDLYCILPSAPCRSVLMLGKELGIEFNRKSLKLLEPEQEQLKPEFRQVRPLPCVLVLLTVPSYHR